MSLATFMAGIMSGGGPTFNIGFSGSPYFIFDAAGNPGDARAAVEIRANGDIFRSRLNQSDGVIGSWVQGSGWDPNDYDFRWVSGGSNPNWGPSDPIDTWINGGGTLTWGVEETGFGVSSADGGLEVRLAGIGGALDTGPIDMNAEST